MAMTRKQAVDNSLISIGAVSLIFAVCCGILYFMGFDIFSRSQLQWAFVYGLASAGAGFSVLALRGIWDTQ